MTGARRAAVAISMCDGASGGGACRCGSGRRGKRPEVSLRDFGLLTSMITCFVDMARFYTKKQIMRKMKLTEKQYEAARAVGQAFAEDCDAEPSIFDCIKNGFLGIEPLIDGCHVGDVTLEMITAKFAKIHELFARAARGDDLEDAAAAASAAPPAPLAAAAEAASGGARA